MCNKKCFVCSYTHRKDYSINEQEKQKPDIIKEENDELKILAEHRSFLKIPHFHFVQGFAAKTF